jgi:large subunit ribosomal protein L21
VDRLDRYFCCCNVHFYSYISDSLKNRFFTVTYSIIETGSKQYRVAVGDRLEVERLAAEPGQAVTFDRVLLLNNEGKLSVGSPTVGSATVVADVLENIRGEKKLTYKLKRRKGYRKTIGHRQELTVVKIKEITGPGVAAAKASEAAGAPKAEEKAASPSGGKNTAPLQPE